MRSNPHILEINTRQWLWLLREKYGATLTLGTIPDEEWVELKHLGFDAVWLMGVWQTSSKAELIARATDSLVKEVTALKPEASLDDIAGSPYSVYDYVLAPEFGKPEELAALHVKLNEIGIKLFLDYISNHLSIDHPLTRTCPDCFIQADPEEVKYHNDWFFEAQTDAGVRHLAYGRDPNFPAWKDTAQLNYFNPAARQYMMETLLRLTELCDGVRCDMVMLSLNDVHEGTWGWLLKKQGYNRPAAEFWPEAIRAAKEKNPHFTFLAEVYWGLEWRVQEMGFDYTYDKVLYDRLRYLGPSDVRGHLRAEKLYQKRSVRFIENHDEMPALTAFGAQKSLVAALVTATLRGMRLFHLGQIMGVPTKIPIQYKKFDIPGDSAIRKYYDKILKIADHPAFHGGEWNLLDVRPVAQGDESNANLLCWSWTQRRTVKMVVINYSPTLSHGRITVSAPVSGKNYTFYDEMAEIFFTRTSEEVKGSGLFVELPPFGVHVLDLEF